jgi:hypothetical protein
LRLLLRNATERARIVSEIQQEVEPPLRRAAGVARHSMREAREQIGQAKAVIERTRRDTRLSFPHALDGVSADGMISLELLRRQIVPVLGSATPAAMLEAAITAKERQDAVGFLEHDIIERIAESSVLSSNMADLAAAKALREHIAMV